MKISFLPSLQITSNAVGINVFLIPHTDEVLINPDFNISSLWVDLNFPNYVFYKNSQPRMPYYGEVGE